DCTAALAGAEVACNEDDNFLDNGDPDPDVLCDPVTLSRVCFPTTDGGIYWIVTTSFDEASVGQITVNVVSPCIVPDICACPADVDDNQIRDGRDIQAFVDCAIAASPTGNCTCGDTNDDDEVDDLDIADFVDFLLDNTGDCP
ncbi:MAG TPA: hypothetical protein VNT79_17545, partial [Phycisphaerae bacterium]|nr:hypothetical protein [Phycisphaerae bacterium]